MSLRHTRRLRSRLDTKERLTRSRRYVRGSRHVVTLAVASLTLPPTGKTWVFLPGSLSGCGGGYYLDRVLP